MRATSDPLWRALAEFRRRLIVGGEWTTGQWAALLYDILEYAHGAGLKPDYRGVGAIALPGSEAAAVDPDLFDVALLDGEGHWIVLFDWGPDGWIQENNLAGGFAEHGGHAIRWAEGWMLARERQLCGTADEPEKATPDDLRPARWFAKATGTGLYPDLLKRARTDGRLVLCDQVGNRWRYSVGEVCRLWPQYRPAITAKLAGETVPNGTDR